MTNNFKAHLGGSEKLRGEEEEETAGAHRT